MEILTESPRETQEAGKNFAGKLKRRLPAGRQGEVLALSGDLGSGKTTFTQGLAQGLGVKERIVSPTFILMRQHEVKSEKGKVKSLYHIDLYRLEEGLEQEFKNLGIEDIWQKPENIVAIEWAEKVKDLLPDNTVWIRFEDLGGDRRKIEIDEVVY